MAGDTNLDDFDIEENHIRTVNSSYYDLHDFIKLTNCVKNVYHYFMSILEVFPNILIAKNVLHASKIIFDFKGVSETKQLINKDLSLMLILRATRCTLNLLSQPPVV